MHYRSDAFWGFHKILFKKSTQALLVVSLGTAFLVSPSSETRAAYDCATECTELANEIISQHEDTLRPDVTEHIADEFNQHRDWLTNTFAREQVIPALQLFTEQMTAVAMQQTMIIGTFFDAKHQLETQRLFQELQVQAHKDYQPSTAFCTFGTAARSLASSEAGGRYTAVAMGERQLARHLGLFNFAGADNAENDKVARWEQFRHIYCDPQDNNWQDAPNTGLVPDGAGVTDPVCLTDEPPVGDYNRDKNRINIDIDYTRAIENKRTLDIARQYDVASNDEIDIQALGNNLYGSDILFRDISRSNLTDDDKPDLFLTLRSIAAKRSVAENSFNTIVGIKSLGDAAGVYTTTPIETYRFMGRLIMELGVPEDEVHEYLDLPYAVGGSTPPSASDRRYHMSYYSQLEIMAKKIYQNPDFYANLYDKPANVQRTSAALKAIELMLDRAIYESQIRQEMAMSVLLSSRIGVRFFDVNKSLQGDN